MADATTLIEAEAAVAESNEEREQVSIWEYVESLLVTILLALFLTTFVVQSFKIPSQSMEPTLLVGDHLLVNKFIFGGTGAWYEKLLPYRAIRHGDIIVFRFPYDDHPYYVKRVIGLPGDAVRIVDQQVFVNGQLLNEPYVVHDPTVPYDPFGDTFPPTTSRYMLRSVVRPEWADQILDHVSNGELIVPPGKYFVMGDNRDRSSDSRFWGFVDRTAIMGGPVVIYWSIDSTEDLSEEESFGVRMREMADTLMHLPSRTRWHRMFHQVR
ncbi:MAG TPA: signal peptidase I [Candidatus Acidoferrales bacterium]|jgi:signal peptidase I|nr:signal peptidase I [Candidatus Acidoferrales bacterium]